MIDLFSDEMRRNPYPVYDQMRAASPVFYLPPFDLWMIFDFEGVKRALVDHDALATSGGAERAVARLPESATRQVAVYRGWMLRSGKWRNTTWKPAPEFRS